MLLVQLFEFPSSDFIETIRKKFELLLTLLFVLVLFILLAALLKYPVNPALLFGAYVPLA